MEIAPNNLEVCLKLNRFVCNNAENDVVALTESRVRILSSHELSTVTTVALSGRPLTLPTLKPPKQQGLPGTSALSASETKENDFDEANENAVYIDGGAEEVPKRKSAKFMQLLNQERKNRWTAESSFPVDGTDPASREHSSRISKGMHPPPKLDAVPALNPIRQSDLLAKQIRDEMFLDILAQQRSQNAGDNMSQVSAMSAKERILKTGHATGLPDYLRQL